MKKIYLTGFYSIIFILTLVSSVNAAVSITSPKTDDILKIGDFHRITWSDSLTLKETVNLGFKTCESCLDWISFTAPNLGYFDWKVGYTDNNSRISNFDYTGKKVQITLTGNNKTTGSQVNVQSGYFSLKPADPAPELPNGGLWLPGDTVSINWTPSGTTCANIDLYNPPESAVSVINNCAPNKGTYTWVVKEIAPWAEAVERTLRVNGVGIKKVIVARAPYIRSTIPASVKTNGVLKIDGVGFKNVQDIFNNANEKIEAYVMSSDGLKYVTNYIKSDKEISFVPSAIGLKPGKYEIEVYDYSRGRASNRGYFVVVPEIQTIKVESPNGGEIFKAGTSVKVEYRSNSIGKNHVIDLIAELDSKSYFVGQKEITAEANAFSFIIPAGIRPGRYVVRVCVDCGLPTQVFDTSDLNFKVESNTTSASPVVTLVSTDTDAVTGTSSNDDVGLFKIRFKVQALGGAVYLSSLPTEAVSFIVDKGGVATTARTISSTFTNITDSQKTSFGNYEIKEGDQETFELVVAVPLGAGGTAGQYRLSLTGIKWNNADTAVGTKKIYNTGLENFKTSYKVLNYGDRASQIASIQAALDVLIQALRDLKE